MAMEVLAQLNFYPILIHSDLRFFFPQVSAHSLYIGGDFVRCRNEGCTLEALRKNRYRYRYVIKGQERYSKCPLPQVEHLHELRVMARGGSWKFVNRPFSIFGSRHCCKELLPVPDHFCHYFESLTTTYHTTGHQSPAALPGLPELWILWRSLLSAEKKCGCSLAPPTTMIVMSLWKFVGRWNSVALFLDSWEQVWQHPWIHVCLIMILGCTVLYDFGFGGNSFHWKFELGGSAWLEIACFSLSGCKLSRCGCKLIRWSFLEVPCSAPAPSWNSLFGI